MMKKVYTRGWKCDIPKMRVVIHPGACFGSFRAKCFITAVGGCSMDLAVLRGQRM